MKYLKMKQLFLATVICIGEVLTLPSNENVAAVVRFSNSLVPPLFQIFSGNHTNLVLSPFGLATTIAITMDCVQGEPYEEIIKLFKLQSKSAKQQLRTGFKTILEDFRADAMCEELAGSYSKAYLTTSRTFSAPIMDILSNNYLVEIKTNSSIAKHFPAAQILELRTDSGIMSHWRDYQKLVVFTYLSHSLDAPFYTNINKTISIPMIPLIGYFRAGLLPHLDCQGAELLFENKKASLLLLMPNKVDELSQLRANLFKENFFDILDALPQQETQIMIPQMSAVTNNLELIPFLKLLGIKSVFKSNNSNNPKNKSNVYVQSVKQSAFFSTGFSALNTIGTIATKFNTKNLFPTAILPTPSPIRRKRENMQKITFNKPFMYFLIHRESGLIITTGHISQPNVFPK